MHCLKHSNSVVNRSTRYQWNIPTIWCDTSKDSRDKSHNTVRLCLGKNPDELSGIQVSSGSPPSLPQTWSHIGISVRLSGGRAPTSRRPQRRWGRAWTVRDLFGLPPLSSASIQPERRPGSHALTSTPTAPLSASTVVVYYILL